MGFSTVVQQMCVLACCVLAGFIARKAHMMNDELDAGLTKLVLNITLPGMIIGAVIARDSLPDATTIWSMLGFSCLASLTALAIALVMPRLLRLQGSKRGAYSFMTMFGNVGFIGYPVSQSIFGDTAVLYAAIANIPFNILVFTVGILMLSQTGDSALEQLRKCARFMISPPLIACFASLALALLGVCNTGVVGLAMNTLGSMTTPAAMLIVGSNLAKMPVSALFSELTPYVMAMFRLLIVPLTVWIVFRGFVADTTILGVLVILNGMPVATNGTLFSLLYGGDTDSVVCGTFVTTILSLATIPLLVLIVT